MKHSAISVTEFFRAGDDDAGQAHELRTMIDQLCKRLERMGVVPAVDCYFDAPTEKQVRKIIRARRARERFFDASLFADPAWDMLLELFASGIAGRRVSITGLCAAAAVPGTTALRWIKTLEEHDLIVRKEDPLDGRRCFLSLTPQAQSAMAALFSEAGPITSI